jgi:hypothetical protein
MRCVNFIIAHEFVVDVRSKRATAINIHDDILAQIFPIALPVSVFSVFEMTEGDDINNLPTVSLSIRLNDQIINSSKLDINFREGVSRARNIFSSAPIPVSEPGRLEFIIKANDDILATNFFQVKSAASKIQESV